MAPLEPPPPQPAEPRRPLIDRNKFEDEYPIMFKFYCERGMLSVVQLQKVQEMQQRWKAGLVFWLTHDNQEIEIPEWVAVNVIINNKQNVGRGSRICMSLNHTKGYGCNRKHGGMCNYVHECALCAGEDHGVFQKKGNGAWVCQKLGKWYEEETRFKAQGYGDPRKNEEALTELARQKKVPVRAPTRRVEHPGVNVWGLSPVGGRSPASSEGSNVTGTCGTSLNGHSRISPNGRNPQDNLLTNINGATGEVSEGPMPMPPSQPPPPRLPSHWQALWCEEQRAYYYWHPPTQRTTWELPADDDILEAVPPPCRDGTPTTTAASVTSLYSRGIGEPVDKVSPREVLATKQRQQDDNFKLMQANGRHCVCKQHWYPQTSECMRVFKGERVIITWSDPDKQGWAYGHTVDDESVRGYLPLAILDDAARPPRVRDSHDVVTVSEDFKAPDEVGGYLSVAKGDLLRVLFPLEGAWGYVQKCTSTSEELGWVPEVILSDASAAEREIVNQSIG